MGQRWVVLSATVDCKSILSGKAWKVNNFFLLFFLDRIELSAVADREYILTGKCRYVNNFVLLFSGNKKPSFGVARTKVFREETFFWLQ